MTVSASPSFWDQPVSLAVQGTKVAAAGSTVAYLQQPRFLYRSPPDCFPPPLLAWQKTNTSAAKYMSPVQRTPCYS